jgi:hypothetical protein
MNTVWRLGNGIADKVWFSFSKNEQVMPCKSKIKILSEEIAEYEIVKCINTNSIKLRNVGVFELSQKSSIHTAFAITARCAAYFRRPNSRNLFLGSSTLVESTFFVGTTEVGDLSDLFLLSTL